MLRGFRAVDQVASAALLRAGFSGSGPAAWYLLHSIPPEGGRASELARELGVTKQAVGQTLSELLADGYVVKEKDPSDGRAQLIRLTPRGQAVVDAGEAALLDQEKGWGEHMGRTRMRALQATMEEFTAFLEEQSGAQPGTEERS
jgi:DNA-binding MarR family transcriptional regulator